MFGSKGKKQDTPGVFYIDGQPYESKKLESGGSYSRPVNTSGRHSITVWEADGSPTTYGNATAAQARDIEKNARRAGLTTSEWD